MGGGVGGIGRETIPSRLYTGHGVQCRAPSTTPRSWLELRVGCLTERATQAPLAEVSLDARGFYPVLGKPCSWAAAESEAPQCALGRRHLLLSYLILPAFLQGKWGISFSCPSYPRCRVKRTRGHVLPKVNAQAQSLLHCCGEEPSLPLLHALTTPFLNPVKYE